jgi:hypothetical protein
MTPADVLPAEDRHRQVRVAKLLLALDVKLSTIHAADNGVDPGILTLMGLKRDWRAAAPARLRWGTLAVLAGITEPSAPTVALAETVVETQLAAFEASAHRSPEDQQAGAERVLRLI